VLIKSPYDCEARFAIKRETEWVGYKAQVTETCDPERPALITQVTTTAATTTDQQALPSIQAALAAKDLLPAEHLVDAGYSSAEHLVSSQQQYQLDLIGPALRATTWQAQAQQGFELRQFRIDWEHQHVTCPQGQTSRGWSPRRTAAGREWIYVRFATRDCQACPVRSACTHAKGGRTLQLMVQPEYEALLAARQRQTTPEYKALYAHRAGIEATLSQAVRRCDLRHSRYIGLAKTRLQHILTAVALNLVRLIDWLNQPQPAPRRSPAFAALAPAAQFAN
jgi:transposase